MEKGANNTVLIYDHGWQEHRPDYNDPHTNFERLRGRWTEPPRRRRKFYEKSPDDLQSLPPEALPPARKKRPRVKTDVQPGSGEGIGVVDGDGDPFIAQDGLGGHQAPSDDAVCPGVRGGSDGSGEDNPLPTPAQAVPPENGGDPATPLPGGTL